MIPHTFRSDPTTDPASTDTETAVPISGQEEAVDKVNYLTALSSGPIAVNWKNTGSNSIDVRILAGNDPNLADADKAEVLAATSIAAGASLSYADSVIPIAYYQYYWFTQVATSAGSQGASQLIGRHARV